MKCIVTIKSLIDNPYFHNKATKLFKEVIYTDKRPDKNDLEKLLGLCDVLIIGAREKILSDSIKTIVKLPKIIGTLSVGLDHLDIPELSRHKVTVINAPTANVISVAEHIIAVTLALSKRLKEGNEAVVNREGRNGLQTMPNEIYGKTIGLIGYGKISRSVAKLAKCFGMSVIATSKTRKNGSDEFVDFFDFNTVLKNSDIVSISVPYTQSTTNLINSENIGFLKKNAILINTSREGIVSYDAVFNALSSNNISGFSVDADSVPENLSKLSNVIATPHIAGLSNEASDRLDNELIDRIEQYLNNT